MSDLSSVFLKKVGDFFEIGVGKPYKIRAENSEKLSKSVRRNAANVSCFNGRSDPVLTKIDSVEDVEEQMIDAGGAENEKIFRRD